MKVMKMLTCGVPFAIDAKGGEKRSLMKMGA